MEYTIQNFTKRLRELMYDRFPYENEETNLKKHKKRPLHIRDVAFMNNLVSYNGQETMVFEIGNNTAEEKYPYYHILEDAPVIRKRGRASAKTKGSQASIENLGHRNYGRVSFNGKTYSKEYSRNVRGSRNRIGKVSHWTTDYLGNDIFINREANSYNNIHYQYIEKMLNDTILDRIALEFGLTRKRTESTGLGEEFKEQELEDIFDTIDALNSMGEEDYE